MPLSPEVEENALLPLVAIAMATYNGEKFLRAQIESILAQEKVRVCIYIRDDRSEDNTVQIIHEYAQRTGQVFLLEGMPHQLGVTKNFFSIVRDIDLSGIAFLAYSDQDDIWLPNKLARAVEMICIKHVNCYASNLRRGDQEAKEIKNKSFLTSIASYLLNNKTNDQTRYDHYLEAASAGCTLVLDREAALYFQSRIRNLLDKIPLDTSHDWSTYAITRLHGFQWCIDSESFIIYRQHNENAYGANMGLAGINKLVDLFTSGWYRRHILMIDELYNEEANHPPFIETIRIYDRLSILSRWRVALAISRYRRKVFHRITLFVLILCGYFK